MKVSIVMPVYNGERFLPLALDSLCDQTFRDFELIAVDDGSDDGSVAMIESYSGRLNVRMITQLNSGASVAYNRGLDAAIGEYVYMMDQDDIVHPQLLEMSVGAMDATGADYVMFDYGVCEDSELADLQSVFRRRFRQVVTEPLPGDALDWFVRQNRNPGIWQFLLRRQAFSGYRFRPGITLEDNLFVFPMLADPELHGVRLPFCLYGYIQRQSSIMHTSKVEFRMKCLEIILRDLRDKLAAGQYDELVVRHYLPVFKTMFRGADRRGRRCVSVSIRKMFLSGLLQRRSFPYRWLMKLWIYGLWTSR